MARPAKPTDRPAAPRFKSRNKDRGNAVSPFAKIGTLRDLSRSAVQLEEFELFMKEIRRGSDRSAAILVALHTQDDVTRLVCSNLEGLFDEGLMKELMKQNAPLGSFYSATLLAFAMGLIDETTKKQLNLIRDIRNAFAHALRPISFKTPEIVEACEKLHRLHHGGDDPLKNCRLSFIEINRQVSKLLRQAAAANYQRRLQKSQQELERLEKARKQVEQQMPSKTAPK